ncbi:MAG: hypothetical protein IJ564_03560 [Alphaproteobacteria bacterium]|nr:hypothetical protein [Alphaproteobacteria bacterium]
MSKENLKFNLKQQSLSFAQDVADKLAYLKSDNVFNQINDVGDYNDELSGKLMSLFDNNEAKNAGIENAEQPQNSVNIGSDSERGIAESPATVYSEPKRAMTPAEKIAMMRGISMPGDYLKKGGF